jgi:hypothetical protein
MTKPEKSQSASAQCDIKGLLNEQENSCVTQHLPAQVAVTYEIHFDRKLRLPYAFYWNGAKQPENNVLKPKQATTILTIQALVKEGDKIGLYLGSDASPEFRQELLYPLTVGSKDIKAIIKTKENQQDDVAELQPVTPIDADKNSKEARYEGWLTGDIWMRFSHRYSAKEATAHLLNAGENDTGIAKAIADLYGGSVNTKTGYSVQFDNKNNCQIIFQTGSDANCRANIKKGYDFAREGLPRVHPRTWIAFLQAARDCSISSMEITSGWRPMFGSATHRIGLGLDIKSVKKANGNTAVFDKKNNHLWQNEEEKSAHTTWIESEQKLTEATRDYANTEAQFKQAKGEDGIRNAKKQREEARNSLNRANNARNEAKKDFNEKHKSSTSGDFEQVLMNNPLIKQLFDPLIMDSNTLDQQEAEANRNRPGDEKGHQNHLHITANDRYLLP